MAVEGIIGIKLGMTQIFAEDGNLVGCTVLQAGPCVVVQLRTKQKDGYEAAQLGLVEFVKPQRVNKAMTGHFKKANVAPMKVMQRSSAAKSRRTKPKSATGCWWKTSRLANWWMSAASARARVLPAA